MDNPIYQPSQAPSRVQNRPVAQAFSRLSNRPRVHPPAEQGPRVLPRLRFFNVPEKELPPPRARRRKFLLLSSRQIFILFLKGRS
ncbi:MAG: hypothetical protein D6715_03500 [Calditrichaeota bacterium]|nr:MAG: hypothetical protein D6715_03500 [Calditrichota bacterium]